MFGTGLKLVFERPFFTDVSWLQGIMMSLEARVECSGNEVPMTFTLACGPPYIGFVSILQLINRLCQYSTPILMQLQSIPTLGASDVVAFQTTSRDWYLVIANGGDNMDNPNVDSLVLRWNGTAFQQSQVDCRSVCM